MNDEKNVEVTVRAVEATDFEALADLMTQLGYETRASEMQMRMEPILANKNYATFVGISDGKVCGMIGTFTCYTYEHNSPSARILALVVSEKMRGRGVGEALIAAAEKNLAQRNIKRVAVNARFERTRAHEFYQKLGYRKDGFRLVKELPLPAD
jgi:ribosomal protein S18 acetylase RimI-like enzyme